LWRKGRELKELWNNKGKFGYKIWRFLQRQIKSSTLGEECVASKVTNRSFVFTSENISMLPRIHKFEMTNKSIWIRDNACEEDWETDKDFPITKRHPNGLKDIQVSTRFEKIIGKEMKEITSVVYYKGKQITQTIFWQYWLMHGKKSNK
jgi:hypothetical protein